MSYHYRREPGTQGTIHTVDGPAQGQDLAGLLQMGRPPLRACLEIGSALADILTIAEEDQAIHGDINTGDVIIAPDGSVSLDGYGHQRRSTRAPEGRPIGPLSDVFGLGVVMHSLLSSGGLGMLPRDPDAHDDAVVDHVMDMDFGGLEGRRWLDDVRRFLCTVMAFDPQERPAPLDAANVLVRVAEQAPGPGVSEWAAQMVRGAPAPAPAPLAPPPAPEPAGPESLGGPRNLSAPMSRPLEARQAPASKGATTEMWTRERLAALLAEEDAEEGGWDAPAERLDGPRQATPAPAMPGWDAPAQPGAWDPERPPRSSPWEQAPGTQPWSSSPPQSPGALPGLEPPPLGQTGFDDPSPEPAPPFSPSPPPPPARGPAGRTAAPRPPAPPAPPSRPAPPPPPSRPSAPARPAPARPAPPPPPGRAAPPPPPGRAAPPPPPGRPTPPLAPGRPAPPPPPTAGTPAQPSAPVAWSPDQDPDAPEEPKSSPLKWVALGAVALFVACLGLGGLGAAVWYLTQDTEHGAAIDHADGTDPHERLHEKQQDQVQDTGTARSSGKALPARMPTADAPDEPADTAAPPQKEPAVERSPSSSSRRSTSSGTTSSSSTRSGSTSSGSTSSSSSSRRSTSSGTTSSSEASGSTSSGSRRSSSGSTSSASTSSTSSTPASAEPVTAGGSYEVKFSLPSKKKATIRCGDGQTKKFEQALRMTFTGTVSCVVEADGARGAVSMNKGGRVSCGISGTDIFCSGPS